MRTERRTPRGFLLVHILAVFPLAAVLLLILGRLANDVVYVQRVAIQHANMISVEDALLRQLQEDVWAAREYTATQDSLTLDTLDRSGRVAVTYTFAAEQIRRATSAGETGVWHCWRLRFGWRIEPGTRGDLVWLDMREAPPPRATAVLPRSFTTTFVLPPAHARSATSQGSPR